MFTVYDYVIKNGFDITSEFAVVVNLPPELGRLSSELDLLPRRSVGEAKRLPDRPQVTQRPIRSAHLTADSRGVLLRPRYSQGQGRD